MSLSDDRADWRVRVLADYRAMRKRHGRPDTPFGKAMRPLQLNATLLFLTFIDGAAKLRNVNRSTYYRRAVAVMAAADLGIDVRKILYETPTPGPWGRQIDRFKLAGARDLGEGIEDWCPHPGCDGAHLLQDEEPLT